MKVSSMSRIGSSSARYSGFIADAERRALAFRATVLTAFRASLCIRFVMSFHSDFSLKDTILAQFILYQDFIPLCWVIFKKSLGLG